MSSTPDERGEAEAKREPLSRERVLRAAIELADEEGIAALSMRRLGQALGVEAMSLYNHVANKDDLLGGMLEMVVGEFEPASPETDWRAAIRTSATSQHGALLRHRWACQLLVSRAQPSAAQLRHSDALLACLRRAGFSVELTHYAFHALDSHVVGFTLWQLSFPFRNQRELVALGRRFLRTMPVDDYPHLAEHIRHHLEPEKPEEESAFDFGLELILDGLERRRAAAQNG